MIQTLVLLVLLLLQSPTEFQGRWAIYTESPFRLPSPFMILELRQAGGEWEPRLVWTTRPVDQMRIQDLSVRGDEIRFVIQSDRTVVLRGRLAGERLEGVLERSDTTWSGTRTEETKLGRPPEPDDHRALSSALRPLPVEEQIQALQKFMSEYPKSPLVEYARYQIIETLLMDDDLDRQRTEQLRFLADYPDSRIRDRVEYLLATGTRDRNERRAALNRFIAAYPESFHYEQAVYHRIRLQRDPEERRRALESFVTEFPYAYHRERAQFELLDLALARRPTDRAAVQAIVRGALETVPDLPHLAHRRARVRQQLAERLAGHDEFLADALELARRALELVSGGGADALFRTTLGKIQYRRGEYEQARESLEQAIRNGPSGEARFYLAKILEERDGDLDGAIEGFLEAFTRRGGVEARRALESAYRKRHGNLETLHPKLDELFRARTPTIDAGRFERDKRPAQRVVLAELFTGAGCGPCASSDAAFDALLRRYDRATVATLQYHLHIPGPDPMTTPETEARARYYGTRATPTLVLDGLEHDKGGGKTPTAVFRRYTARLEPRLAVPPAVSIDAEVERTTGHIAVRGTIRPVRSGLLPATLQLVLAEEEIHYTGANQVHFHHYVARAVRSRPIDLGTGEISFKESFDLATLEDDQKRYLDRYLEDNPDAQWNDEIPRPAAERLIVVAFVQNDDSREVLQAAVAR